MHAAIVISALIGLNAIIALAIHAAIAYYRSAIVLTAIVTTSLLYLLRSNRAPWQPRDITVFGSAFVISLVVSAFVGAPFAARRRRKREAVRGFDVIGQSEK